jgi:4-diphosphocytidyl-2-C-methyl-D-erythritol kinase
MARTEVVRQRAFAKLNLALSVGAPIDGGNLDSGMHPLVSWMHAIDLADDVEIQPLPEGEPSSWMLAWQDDALTAWGDSPHPTWARERDLAWRAHRLMERVAGRPLPAAITIRKRVPIGAGLGGGSSDGAGALMALNQAFDLDIPLGSLASLAGELGSDVPFFVDLTQPPRPAIVCGLGERTDRVGRTTGQIVLILPPFPCPTQAVYAAYDSLGPRELREQDVRNLALGGVSPSASLFNDLAAAAEHVQPRLRELRRQCVDLLGRPVHLTGSGSALFAIADGAEQASDMAAALAAAVPGAVAAPLRLI